MKYKLIAETESGDYKIMSEFQGEDLVEVLENIKFFLLGTGFHEALVRCSFTDNK